MSRLDPSFVSAILERRIEFNLASRLPRPGFINGAEGALSMPSLTQTERVKKKRKKALFPLERHQGDYFCSFKLLKRGLGQKRGGGEVVFSCEQQTASRARSVMRSSELGAG